MKRKQVVLWLARLAPLLACLLTGCTMSGNTSCNTGIDGQMCWMDSNQQGNSNVGIFFEGTGCDEICELRKNCTGRIEALVKYDPPLPGQKVLEITEDSLDAMCIPP